LNTAIGCSSVLFCTYNRRSIALPCPVAHSTSSPHWLLGTGCHALQQLHRYGTELVEFEGQSRGTSLCFWNLRQRQSPFTPHLSPKDLF